MEYPAHVFQPGSVRPSILQRHRRNTLLLYLAHAYIDILLLYLPLACIHLQFKRRTTFLISSRSHIHEILETGRCISHVFRQLTPKPWYINPPKHLNHVSYNNEVDHEVQEIYPGGLYHHPNHG